MTTTFNTNIFKGMKNNKCKKFKLDGILKSQLFDVH